VDTSEKVIEKTEKSDPKKDKCTKKEVSPLIRTLQLSYPEGRWNRAQKSFILQTNK